MACLHRQAPYTLHVLITRFVGTVLHVVPNEGSVFEVQTRVKMKVLPEPVSWNQADVVHQWRRMNTHHGKEMATGSPFILRHRQGQMNPQSLRKKKSCQRFFLLYSTRYTASTLSWPNMKEYPGTRAGKPRGVLCRPPLLPPLDCCPYIDRRCLSDRLFDCPVQKLGHGFAYHRLKPLGTLTVRPCPSG